MVCKSFCFLIFSCIVAIHAAPNQSIPFNKLGAEAAKTSGNKGLSVTELWNGYRLECRMQDLLAEVTMSGTTIRSTSEREGQGAFIIRAERVGRERLMKEIPTAVDWINADDGVVRCRHGNVVEEYTTSGDGIRQDFVITSRPGGKGRLVLELAVEGADPVLVADAIKVRLASGRELVYHALKVTDAAGKALEARFEKAGHCFEVAIDDNGAKYPVRVDPTITDADWISMGGIPGVEGYVAAIALDSSGNLYVGGDLTIAGNVFAHNIVKWDGTAWSTLGGGTNGRVNDIKVDNSGNLYVGGGFDTAGRIPAKFVAKWDGTEWSALGSGTNSVVRALAIDDSGNVYVGGIFTLAGGMSANRIAKWNGIAWDSLGSGVTSLYATNGIYAVTADRIGNVYVGGGFDTIGGIVANRIARWDGTSWNALDSGMHTARLIENACVLALTVDTLNNLYAGGAFDTAGRTPARRIAKWDGSAWSAVGEGIGGYYSTVQDIAFDTSGNLYACGYFSANYGLDSGGIMANGIARWNGTTWSTLDSGIISGNGLASIAIDNSGNVYAGGYFNVAGGIAANSIAKWDGSSWSAFGSGTNSNVRTLALDSSGNLYTGGTFLSIGGTAANCIAKWDGSAWSALGSGVNAPGYAAQVYAITADGSGNIFVMGTFDTAGEVPASNIARWNGSTWRALGSGIRTDPANTYFMGALAVDKSGNLFVGGDLDTAGDIIANHIARWDGSAWYALGSGTENDIFSLLTDNAGNLYVGGAFDTAGGIVANQIAKWNGSAWDSLGKGVSGHWGDGCVYAMAMDTAGNLYAGGEFDSAGNVAVNHVAKWDGSSWSALGSGITHLYDFDMDIIGVFAIAVDHSGTVYAGGDFSSAGDVPAEFIAQWDGNTWSALGSGFGGNWYCVQNLIINDDNALFACGNFLSAGGKVSPYIAQCKISGSAVQQLRKSNPSLSPLSYNPYSGSIRIDLQSSTDVVYRIFTLSGREVYRDAKFLPKGDRFLKLNTADLSQGTYIAQVKAGNESIRFRVVIEK
jgi:hypothetical protein